MNLVLLVVSFLPVVSSNQERQLERLLLIQSRIAEARIICAKILGRQSLAATHTFRDGVSRKLEMHAAEVGAVLVVDAEG